MNPKNNREEGKKILVTPHAHCEKNFIIFFLLLALAACSTLPTAAATPQNTSLLPEENPAFNGSPTPESTPVAAEVESTPQTLRIWLPPEFDPNAKSEAGQILRLRLENFQKRRPDLLVEVRIKVPPGTVEARGWLQTAAGFGQRHSEPGPNSSSWPRFLFGLGQGGPNFGNTWPAEGPGAFPWHSRFRNGA